MIKFEGDISIVDKGTVQFFNEYKKKAVFNVVLTAKPRDISHLQNKTTATIEIYDTRLDKPFLVGKLICSCGTYTVESPRITNDKYAKWNSQYHTKSSENLKRAVKNAVDYITPFTWRMVAEGSRDTVRRDLNSWAEGPSRKIHDAVQYKISRVDLIDEIQAALEEGRNFHNANMNVAKEVFAQYKEESERRVTLDMKELFVTVDEWGRYVSDKWATPKQESEMHEDILTKIGLLKMMDVDVEKEETATLDEVGVRVSDKVFWVFLPRDIYVAVTNNEGLA
jgi:hypothetical protein